MSKKKRTNLSSLTFLKLTPWSTSKQQNVKPKPVKLLSVLDKGTQPILIFPSFKVFSP